MIFFLVGRKKILNENLKCNQVQSYGHCEGCINSFKRKKKRQQTIKHRHLFKLSWKVAVHTDIALHCLSVRPQVK